MRVICLLLLVASCLATRITNYERTLDLTTNIVKGSAVVTYEADDANVKSVLFVLPSREANNVAFIAASENGVKNAKLTISKEQSAQKGYGAFKIALPKELAKGSSVTLKIEYKIAQILTPLPAKITQMQDQFLYYDGSAFVAAAYPVVKQQSTFKVPSKNIKSYTNISPSTKDSNGIHYGPYADQPAYTEKFVRVHYENNIPNVVATKVDRLIEISHWGNIAVEENIEIINRGAELEGAFSRIDFQMDRRPKSPILQHFKSHLPAAAKDIYYRDVIGNISTSEVELRKSSVDVMIRPRFPLFGGWKTTYTLGYNLPSNEHLYVKGNSYALKMKLYDHIMDNLVVEKFALKIVLPETVKNVELITPYNVVRRPNELLATYLDTTGRTVVVLQKDNLVDDHIQAFTISYEFDYINLLREPLMATAFFFAIFFSIIVYSRLDFTIVDDPNKEANEKVQLKVNELQGLVEKRVRTYDHVLDAVRQFKGSSDEAVLSSAKAKADSTRSELASQIQSISSSLSNTNKGAYDKLFSELAQIENQLKNDENSYLAFARKSKTKEGPEDKAYVAKIGDARHRIETVLASF